MTATTIGLLALSPVVAQFSIRGCTAEEAERLEAALAAEGFRTEAHTDEQEPVHVSVGVDSEATFRRHGLWLEEPAPGGTERRYVIEQVQDVIAKKAAAVLGRPVEPEQEEPKLVELTNFGDIPSMG